MQRLTTSTVDFVSTTDPLLRDLPLTQSVVLVILGIETCFETNSVYVRELVEETFGQWSQWAESAVDRVHVRIIVQGGTEHGDARPPVRHISTHDGRLIVQSSGSVALVDPSRRESLAYVTTALAAERELFRTTVVEAITFALLAPFDRHPIHAAAIASAGRALLLVGPGGMGKSTLAYLAHTAGYGVLSDDRVWVQTEPHLRIWGGPVRIRLTAAAASRFHEIRTDEITQRAEEGGKIVVALASTNQPSDRSAASAAACLLERGRRAALERVSPADASAAILSQLAPGFDRFPQRVDRVVAAVTAGGGWRLTLTENPRDALPYLRRMLYGD